MPRPILAAAVASCWIAASAGAAERILDGIAAQVGGQIVLISEVMDMVTDTEREMRAAGAPESEIAKLRAEGLERMIEWRLIEQVVKRAELYASDAEVDETIATIARENQITLEQLRQSVVANGLSFADYRAQIKRELERRKVVNSMIGSKVRVEESEALALYEQRFSEQPGGGVQYHVRQLLIPAGPGRDLATVCGAVRAAQVRLAEGEPFQALAQRLSAVAPERGGDIGWVHEDSLAPWMVAALSPLAEGQVSDLIELPFGCSLLELVERREYQPVSFEQVRPMLEQEIFEQKLAAEYADWMEKLRERTYIDRRGYFADAARFGEQSFPGAEGATAP
jgi:peptidyl-prolyl cis-trans isomerase SurA